MPQSLHAVRSDQQHAPAVWATSPCSPQVQPAPSSGPTSSPPRGTGSGWPPPLWRCTAPCGSQTARSACQTPAAEGRSSKPEMIGRQVDGGSTMQGHSVHLLLSTSSTQVAPPLPAPPAPTLSSSCCSCVMRFTELRPRMRSRPSPSSTRSRPCSSSSSDLRSLRKE